jgi:glutathione synthase/RimK-type ligase-like ATP-grasp enzyme
VDRRTTTLHKLYVLSAEQIAAVPIPQVDAIFVAIAESDENVPALSLAGEIVRSAGLPYVNDPQRVLGTNRVRVASALANLSDAYVPPTTRVPRGALESGSIPAEFALIIRPVGSQAGRDLARIDDRAGLAEYLRRVQAEWFYVMPFVDFKKADGYHRKYRIIVVDGVPYPYHLAISPNWMIHYYNAPMRENAWMREEEEHFLAHFEEVFDARLQRALREIGAILGLEYFGIDCSIDPQGRLLVFEADPAMIVHAGDDPQLFGYKKPYAQRIFDAFQKLIDRVGSR